MVLLHVRPAYAFKKQIRQTLRSSSLPLELCMLFEVRRHRFVSFLLMGSDVRSTGCNFSGQAAERQG